MTSLARYTSPELMRALIRDLVSDLRLSRRASSVDNEQALERQIRCAMAIRHHARFDAFGWPWGVPK